MEESVKIAILVKAKKWFQELVDANLSNVNKLTDPSQFNINPFTVNYLANFLTGNSSKSSIAKALIYPRVLGTSIATSFGTAIQKFSSTVLDGFASTTSGIDIEFVDSVDGRKKFCQMKAGPNTINRDDVTTIADHFKKVTRLARTNNLMINSSDFVVGVVYGEAKDLSGHYKSLYNDHNFVVLAGKDFWQHLTGDENFYDDLISVASEIAVEQNSKKLLNQVIADLAKNLE